MNLFALSGLFCTVVCSIFTIISLVYGRTKIHRLLVFFNVAVVAWGLGLFFAGVSSSGESALAGWRFAQIGGIFIATFFYHLTYLFCNLNRKKILIAVYVVSLFFTYFCIFTNLLFSETRYCYGVYYNKATFMYTIMLFIWVAIVLMGFLELVRYYYIGEKSRRLHTKYMILGFLIH